MGERTIWKFPLIVAGEQRIHMPSGAALLSVAVQRGQPCLWALVDPESTPTERRLRIYGTGHPVDEPVIQHVGSFMLEDGAFVGHVFDGGEV